MLYTEEDIREAFRGGMAKGRHNSYFDAPLNEDEYVDMVKSAKSNYSTQKQILVDFLMEVDEVYAMHVRENAEKCVDSYLNKK